MPSIVGPAEEAHDSRGRAANRRKSADRSIAHAQSARKRGIRSPHPHDVLCGRGGASNNHEGNTNYRHVVERRKRLFASCPTRHKNLIARSIVEAIRRAQDPPGRFLEKDKCDNLWYEIDYWSAVEKTKQALRDSRMFNSGTVKEGDGRKRARDSPGGCARKQKKPETVNSIAAAEGSELADRAAAAAGETTREEHCAGLPRGTPPFCVKETPSRIHRRQASDRKGGNAVEMKISSRRANAAIRQPNAHRPLPSLRRKDPAQHCPRDTPSHIPCGGAAEVMFAAEVIFKIKRPASAPESIAAFSAQAEMPATVPVESLDDSTKPPTPLPPATRASSSPLGGIVKRGPFLI